MSNRAKVKKIQELRKLGFTIVGSSDTSKYIYSVFKEGTYIGIYNIHKITVQEIVDKLETINSQS